MPKKVDEYIHILCPSRAYLAPVKLMGPIVHPLKVKKTVAAQLLLSGAKVYEYVPKSKKTLELTLNNIKDPSRYDAIIEKPVSKAVKVEPVEKTGVPVKPETEEVDESAGENNVYVTPEEEEPTPVTTTTVNALDDLVFEFNEDGTINESNINWASFTKSQRKALRSKINTYNASVKAVPSES